MACWRQWEACSTGRDSLLDEAGWVGKTLPVESSCCSVYSVPLV